MTSEMQVASLLREEVSNLMASSFFLFTGVTALLIAGVRRSRGLRILIWIGLWSAAYGARDLAGLPVLILMLPPAYEPARQFLIVCFSCVIIVPATLAFMELTIGALRRVLQVLLITGITIDAGCHFVVSHFWVAEHFSRLQPVARGGGFSHPDCRFVRAEIVKAILGSFTTQGADHRRSNLFP